MSSHLSSSLVLSLISRFIPHLSFHPSSLPPLQSYNISYIRLFTLPPALHPLPYSSGPPPSHLNQLRYTESHNAMVKVSSSGPLALDIWTFLSQRKYKPFQRRRLSSGIQCLTRFAHNRRWRLQSTAQDFGRGLGMKRRNVILVH